MSATTDPNDRRTFKSRRRRELLIFLALAYGIWPLVAFGSVGAYGFIVWMTQLVWGPPGPPTAGH